MSVSLNRRRGKRNEQALARRLGAKRLGILGKEDLHWGAFSVETKERKKLPIFLTKSYEQAIRNAPNGKIPLLIFHELGKRRNSDLVVMDLISFEKVLEYIDRG